MMVLRTSMSDAELAARVLAGDGQAFAELADRYREMIGFTIRNPAEGLDRDDERQDALLALLEACRRFDPARGSFGAIATVRVRSRVWNARRRTRSGRNRILTDALRLEHRAVDEEDSDATLADTIADREGTDPARVVELREELRERVIARREDQRAKRRARDRRRRALRPPRERRGRDDPQIGAALALLAEGKTTREAGAEVGVASVTVSRWSRRFA
jgi:RNA polymerase sigma factor (sigma-70 family)